MQLWYFNSTRLPSFNLHILVALGRWRMFFIYCMCTAQDNIFYFMIYFTVTLQFFFLYSRFFLFSYIFHHNIDFAHGCEREVKVMPLGAEMCCFSQIDCQFQHALPRLLLKIFLLLLDISQMFPYHTLNFYNFIQEQVAFLV